MKGERLDKAARHEERRRNGPTQTTPRRSLRHLAASWILKLVSATSLADPAEHIPKHGLARTWRAPNLRHMALLNAAMARVAKPRAEQRIKCHESCRDEAAVVLLEILQGLCGRDSRETVFPYA